MLQMYMNASFKAWSKLYKKNIDKRQQEITQGLDKFALQSDDDDDYYMAHGRKK